MPRAVRRRGRSKSSLQIRLAPVSDICSPSVVNFRTTMWSFCRQDTIYILLSPAYLIILLSRADIIWSFCRHLQIQFDHFTFTCRFNFILLTVTYRYNLKRKVASLPPVTESVFSAKSSKLGTTTQTTSSDSRDTIFRCAICNKNFNTENALKVLKGWDRNWVYD